MKAVLLRFLSMELLCDTLPTQSLTSSHSQTQLRTACKQPQMLLYTTASASPPLRPTICIILPHHPFLAMFSCNWTAYNVVRRKECLFGLLCVCVSLSPLSNMTREHLCLWGVCGWWFWAFYLPSFVRKLLLFLYGTHHLRSEERPQTLINLRQAFIRLWAQKSPPHVYLYRSLYPAEEDSSAAALHRRRKVGKWT